MASSKHMMMQIRCLYAPLQTGTDEFQLRSLKVKLIIFFLDFRSYHDHKLTFGFFDAKVFQ